MAARSDYEKKRKEEERSGRRIHHDNPSLKEEGVTRMLDYSWEGRTCAAAAAAGNGLCPS